MSMWTLVTYSNYFEWSRSWFTIPLGYAKKARLVNAVKRYVYVLIL